MRPRKPRPDPEKRAEILAEVHRNRLLREQGYREQALRLFPHVCARCGREFSGNELRELTVHHKDGNHLNNPPDGGNWELLCLYCHDAEHQTPLQRAHYESDPLARGTEPPLTFRAFEGLKDPPTPENGKTD
ncbi:MAG TPA: YajD family HNH nuclease [Candidatus Hydrogenedentes bacterium]|nr:YajD family HNH nuclease [Candidatus Hydrogenedentota bacterium]